MPSFPRTLAVAVSGLLLVATLGACGALTVTAGPGAGTTRAEGSATGSAVPAAPEREGRSSGPVTPSARVVPPASPQRQVPAGRWAVGDSVMLGARALLTALGVRVDAVESRQFHAGIPLVRAALAAGSLPRNVIVHLGTNGTASLADCRAIVSVAGSARRVFLVTVHGPRPWMHADNAQLAACAASFPARRVVLVNWDGAASHHPEWFYRDGIHLNPSGRAAYATLVTKVVSTFAL